MIADFLSETMETRKKWHNNFQALKEKNYPPSFVYPVKTSLRNKVQIMTFSDEEKLIELFASKLLKKNG